MSDFEARVRDALGSAAERAPSAAGLAQRARGRARVRRRTTLVVAAVVLAVVAVPVGILAAVVAGGDDPSDPAPSDGIKVPPDWRSESWRDLEVRVPPEWGSGRLTTWCQEGRQAGDPAIGHPARVVYAVTCEPGRAYGAEFVIAGSNEFGAPFPEEGEVAQVPPEDAESFPEGAWIGYREPSGPTGVVVVAKTEDVARAVLGSVRAIDRVDSNGCPVRLSDRPPFEGDGMAVCRYRSDTPWYGWNGMGGEPPSRVRWLEESQLLDPDDAGRAEAALEAAPLDQTVGGPIQCGGTRGVTTILMRTSREEYEVRVGSNCPQDDGVFHGAERSQLTVGVMRWALSPGWRLDLATGDPWPTKRLGRLPR